MALVLNIVFQIAAFLLFQTMLLHLVGQSKYEKYIRTFSGFLLILLLVSAIRSVLEGGNLMEEVERQVEFATEEEDFRLLLQQAEESQRRELQQGYEERILEEAAACLEEERYFLSEGSVSFSTEWELEELSLIVSRTWGESMDGKAENGENYFDNPGKVGSGEEVIEEIWIEPIEEIEPIRQVAPAGQATLEEQTTSVGQETSKELAILQSRLAKRLGIREGQIVLRWRKP